MSNDEDDFWDETPESKGEIVNLEPGDFDAGVLTNIIDSEKYGNKLYRFRRDDHTSFGIWGSTQLNRLMAERKIGDNLKVERVADVTLKSGRVMKAYKTFLKKKKEE